MTAKQRSGLRFGILLSALLVLLIFSFSFYGITSPVVVKTFPSVPKEGEPMIVAFSLKNFQNEEKSYEYELYANGVKVMEGTTRLPQLAVKQYQYSYKNPLPLGERLTFNLRVTSRTDVQKGGSCWRIRIRDSCLTGGEEHYEKTVSIPAYPPQVWSSFVSFATFSTAISSATMSSLASTSTISLASMNYCQNTYGFDKFINVGVIFSVALLFILISVEVTEPYIRALNFVSRLRLRFNRLSLVLFTIFIAMVFTEIILIIG
jgi:hypothetical protein